MNTPVTQPNRGLSSRPSERSSGVRRTIVKWMLAISICVLGLFAFSLLGRFFFMAELVGNFRGQILAMLVVAGTISVMARRWPLAALIGVAVIWSMNGVVSVYLPARQPPSGPESLKIMSFNVLMSNQQFDDTLAQIDREDPDVLVLLEYTPAWDAVIPDRLTDYPYQIREPRSHALGIAMFSKYPLDDPVVVPMSKELSDNPAIIANVNFKGQTIRVVGIHLISPVSPDRLRLRNRQFEEMADRLAKSNEPTVVTGDFNCTPWSPFLTDFLATTGYRDSRQGFGYQATWHASSWPIQIPIDHAFVSPDIHVHDRHVGLSDGSDHLPIVFELSIAPIDHDHQSER